jgi:putative CocE/NonD family hydrolase
LEAAGIVAERNLPVTMRDGVILRCNLHRPVGEGRWPVLLLRLPYDKDVAQTYVYSHPAWYARQGYAVVVQDSRGRFDSDGDYYPLRQDAEDGSDTIAWCAAQPWSNGKVGSYGFSIPGINQLLAAAELPTNLVTACPAFYPGGMYEGFVYSGGAFGLSAVAHWGLILAADAAARQGDRAALAALGPAMQAVGSWHPTLPLMEIPFLTQPDVMPFLADYLAHPTHSDYWREWDLEPRLEAIDIPCLHVSGWYDSFIDQTIPAFQRLAQAGRAEHRLLVGPWYHIPWTQQVGAIDFGEAARNVVNEYQLAWFDAWLKGERGKLDALQRRRSQFAKRRWRALARAARRRAAGLLCL